MEEVSCVPRLVAMIRSMVPVCTALLGDRIMTRVVLATFAAAFTPDTRSGAVGWGTNSWRSYLTVVFDVPE
jgi:hypothetical protein